MVQIVLEFEILQFHMKKKIQVWFVINLLEINCSQNFLLKMCKKIVQNPLVDINNINE
jgi:hypothetical protein